MNICKHYEAGLPLREISKRVGVSQATIISVIRKYDIPLRGKRRTSSDKKELVVQLYNQGLTIDDIIEQSGVKSEQTIYQILNEKGIPRRVKLDTAKRFTVSLEEDTAKIISDEKSPSLFINEAIRFYNNRNIQ